MAKNTSESKENRGPKGSEWFWTELDSYLHRNHMKQTKQREKIVSHFLVSKSHLSAEDLAIDLKANGFEVGLATDTGHYPF